MNVLQGYAALLAVEELIKALKESVLVDGSFNDEDIKLIKSLSRTIKNYKESHS